jgi:hypothetical protein
MQQTMLSIPNLSTSIIANKKIRCHIYHTKQKKVKTRPLYQTVNLQKWMVIS